MFVIFSLTKQGDNNFFFIFFPISLTLSNHKMKKKEERKQKRKFFVGVFGLRERGRRERKKEIENAFVTLGRK